MAIKARTDFAHEYWLRSKILSQLQNIERQENQTERAHELSINRMRIQENNCVITRLITEGSYELLVNKILAFLDFQSLVSCGKVCYLWRASIKTVIKR